MANTNVPSFSYETIKKIIKDKFKQVNNHLAEVSDASNINLFSGITASMMHYLTYLIKMETRENYFDTCLDSNNLAYLARNYSYSIARPVAPMVSVEYLGHQTSTLTTNQKLGKIEVNGVEMGLYYGGKHRQVEYGDRIDLSVGILNSVTLPMIDGLIKTEIKPSELKAVDNDFLNIVTYKAGEVIDKVIQVSPVLEDFTDGKPSQISNGKFNAEVYITDNSRNRRNGIVTSRDIEHIVVYFLETNGHTVIDAEDIELLNPSFGVVGVSSFGMDEETDESIRTYAKFQYFTNKRMITPEDHNAILSNFSQFRTVNTVRDLGRPQIIKLQIKSLEDLKQLKELVINTGESSLTGLVNRLVFRIALLPYKHRPFDYYYRPAEEAQYTYYTPDDQFYNDRLNEAYRYFKAEIEDVTTLIKAEISIDEANAVNSYIKLSIDPSLNLTFEPYWNMVELQERRLPKGCCASFVYYVHRHTEATNPVILTTAEMRAIAEKTIHYKGNSQLIFIPAQPEAIDITISISAYNDEDKIRIQEIITKLIEEKYDYAMNREINDAILLGDIHNKLNLEGLSLVSIKIHTKFNYTAKFLEARYFYVNSVIFH